MTRALPGTALQRGSISFAAKGQEREALAPKTIRVELRGFLLYGF